jgi:mRNA-degrading endonuclease HigB of HigAB toxin-antitoxin module
MSRFGSADEFLKALRETKFKYVGVPNDWKFAGAVDICKVDNNTAFVEVKGEKFLIVAVVPGMTIIQIPGN